MSRNIEPRSRMRELSGDQRGKNPKRTMRSAGPPAFNQLRTDRTDKGVESLDVGPHPLAPVGRRDGFEILPWPQWKEMQQRPRRTVSRANIRQHLRDLRRVGQIGHVA